MTWGSRRSIVRLSMVFAALQAVDLLSTMVGLGLGAAERNPVGVAMLSVGPWFLAVSKVVGTTIILYVVNRVHGSEGGHRWARAMLLWCSCLMGAVVTWNAMVIGLQIVR